MSEYVKPTAIERATILAYLDESELIKKWRNEFYITLALGEYGAEVTLGTFPPSTARQELRRTRERGDLKALENELSERGIKVNVSIIIGGMQYEESPLLVCVTHAN